MLIINVIRYFIINKVNFGRVFVFVYKKIVNKKNFSDIFKVERSLYGKYKTNKKYKFLVCFIIKCLI